MSWKETTLYEILVMTLIVFSLLLSSCSPRYYQNVKQYDIKIDTSEQLIQPYIVERTVTWGKPIKQGYYYHRSLFNTSKSLQIYDNIFLFYTLVEKLPSNEAASLAANKTVESLIKLKAKEYAK